MRVDSVLNERVVIVTGGGSGIGRAIALQMATEGAIVVATDIVGSRAERVVAEILGDAGQAMAAEADMSLEGAAESVRDQAVRRFGRLDVWINNAGWYPSTPIDDITEDEWHRVFNINLKSVFFGCRVAALTMRPQKRGRIVNIATVDALGPAPGVAHYAAAKAGVISLTRSFAVVLAPYSVTVNAVAPGWVATPPVMAADRWKGALATIPLGRLAQPEEVAAVVCFLSSSSASYITGETVNVNGGLLMT